MKETQVVIGLDIGTTSTKAVVFDPRGHIRGVHSVDYPRLTPHPSWVEQETEEIFLACLDSLRGALRKSEAAKEDVLAIGMSTAMHSIIALDAADPLDHLGGQPLWMCEEAPDTFAQTAKFVSIKEFVLQRLFGEYVVENSIASATRLFNLELLDWDEGVLEVVGVRTEQLSRVPGDRPGTGNHAWQNDDGVGRR